MTTAEKKIRLTLIVAKLSETMSVAAAIAKVARDLGVSEGAIRYAISDTLS